MAKYEFVKLKFLSPIHLGAGKVDEYGVSDKLIHSDTISSALVSVFAQIYSAKQDEIQAFMESFRVSSLFPYYKEVLFFPKPLSDINTSSSQNDLQIELNKKIKKSDYISQGIFEKTLKGEEIDLNSLNFHPPFATTIDEFSDKINVWKSEVQQRVTVPRFDEGESQPFYLDRMFFNENAGLYFLFNVDDKFKNTFFSCLQYLGEQGIGTDKSVGNGQFAVNEKTKVELDVPKDTDHLVSMSLYIPENKKEISKEILNYSAYKIITRGGFMAGSTENEFKHLRKKQISMFTEGSVFKNKELKGYIVDLKPDWSSDKMHPVYRDGRAFTLPIIVK